MLKQYIFLVPADIEGKAPACIHFPFEPAVCPHTVDVMHEELFSGTQDSSVVLTRNIASACPGTDKDRNQLPQTVTT